MITLNRSCHLFAQVDSWSKSFCSWMASSSELIVLYNRQSSANNRNGELKPSAMSLMYKRNIKGPRTVPWGTPDWTITGSDEAPSKTTC